MVVSEEKAPSSVTGGGTWRKSYAGGVIHGIAFAVHQALAEPNSVLPAFLAGLTPARWIVGAMTAMLIGGDYLLQFPSAYFLQGVARRKPYLLIAVGIRASAWAVLGALAYGLPSLSPEILLPLFLGLVLLYSLTGGLGAVAFADMVAGAIPANMRGRFYGLRSTLGSLLAFGSGYVVRMVLAPGAHTYPTNYGLLFLLSGLVLYVGVIGFSFMAEESRTVAPRPPFREYLRTAGRLLGSEPRYRGLLFMQLLSGSAMMAIPFYSLYAREQLGLTAAAVGLFVAMQVAGAAASNLIWGAVRDRFGSLVTARAALSLDLVVPLVALGLGQGLPVAFPVVFFLVGAAMGGKKLAFFNCLVDLAPAAQRPTYVGVNGSLSALSLLFPLTGGVLVEVLGYGWTFGLTALMGIIPIVLSLRMRVLKSL